MLSPMVMQRWPLVLPIYLTFMFVICYKSPQARRKSNKVVKKNRYALASRDLASRYWHHIASRNLSQEDALEIRVIECKVAQELGQK